jgi:hypothetical protein
MVNLRTVPLEFKGDPLRHFKGIPFIIGAITKRGAKT